MCGRYLIDEEAYSDILEILYRAGAMSDTIQGTVSSLPPVIKESMAATMTGLAQRGAVSETVPGKIHELFTGSPGIVTNGEVFPTNTAPVLISGGDGIMAAKWGFPHWKNSTVIINARAETALEKKMFRQSLLERRCVVPSNGFFEWGSSGSFDILQIGLFGSGSGADTPRSGSRGRKTKYLLRRPDENKLYMAGIWNTFRDITGTEYSAFVILTTAANESVSPLHDRMPVILSPDERDDWLGSDEFMEFTLLRPGPELEAKMAA